MTEQSFETLKTWQKAHQLMLDIHKRLVPVLPKQERYDLIDQIRRSSKSVAANIAEGLAGFITWIMSVFNNARGSLDETLNHLITARDLGYCPIPLYEDLHHQIEEIQCLLNGYISWLKAKKIGQNEPGSKLIIHEISSEYLVDTESMCFLSITSFYFSLSTFYFLL